MKVVGDSFVSVLIGDWNKLYIQPDWVAQNIFENSDMEIGIEGRGSDVYISYQWGNVIINATQDKLIFSTSNLELSTLENLVKCMRNYLDKAVSPVISAYGMNVDYIESEDTKFAELFDNISDARAYIDLSYEVKSSEISRTLIKDGNIIKVKCEVDGSYTKIHFNEHYDSPNKSEICCSVDQITSFIKRTKEIVEKLGYDCIED